MASRSQLPPPEQKAAFRSSESPRSKANRSNVCLYVVAAVILLALTCLAATNKVFPIPKSGNFTIACAAALGTVITTCLGCRRYKEEKANNNFNPLDEHDAELPDTEAQAGAEN